GPGLVAGPIQESALVCQPNLRPAAVLPEKLLGLVEETLALRVHIWVTEFGELLQLGTLGGVQLGWHFDVHAHVQISDAITLDIFHSFALEPKHGARLGARRDFAVRLAARCPRAGRRRDTRDTVFQSRVRRLRTADRSARC